MRRAAVFGVVVAASLAGFAVAYTMLGVYYEARALEALMSGMMGGWMRGSPLARNRGGDAPLYVLLLPSVLVATLILGFGGLLYSLLLPEIKLSAASASTGEVDSRGLALRREKIETIARTMRPDEARVFNILLSNGGRYLQKHISREAGLSRLRTHRTVASLADRGIVTVRPYGNTNEVSLSEWVLSEDGGGPRDAPAS